MTALLIRLICLGLAAEDGPTACAIGGLDDPLLGLQWPIENPGDRECFTRGVDINLPEAWAITCGREEVVVAVLDSGADLDHPELKDRLYPRGDDDWNFTLESSKVPADGFGHGTSVAALACAAAGNGEGIAGIAPAARLMPLKVDGIDLVRNVAAALDYLAEFAVRHPELRIVVNGSFNSGVDSIAIGEAVARAHQAGIVLCFAAGNTGGAVERPAAYPESIAVGAIGPDGGRKRRSSCAGGDWASNHGPELDLVAPGVLLPTADMSGPGGRRPGDYDLEFGGTSAASPIVAGVAALMLSVHPRLAPGRLQEILQATALDLAGHPDEDTPGFDEFMGWGRIDAGRAVAQARREAQAPPGDADCSGGVDLEDVLALLHSLFTGSQAGCPDHREVNGDGGVDMSDAVYLLRWLFRGGPPPKGGDSAQVFHPGG